MKKNFVFSIGFGFIWLLISTIFAIQWAEEVADYLPSIYVWWVIIGIALLPGFFMSSMFFSNLLHTKVKKYPDTKINTTVIMCANNEQANIAKAILAICHQQYKGHIRLLVIDNASTDHTKEIIMKFQNTQFEACKVEYVSCEQLGKVYALNTGLQLVDTPYFITVDADTCLQQYAIQKIMNHIVGGKCACVAGNLFVKNANQSFVTKMQIYDYLLSIAAIKRFQGSYHATLVAQGAFSAYQSKAVKQIGGWKDVLGEDIVLTYQLLQQRLASSYEPMAVGYTAVPETITGLYRQRKRWARGMLEGFSTVVPWKQGTSYAKYFTFVNLSIIHLDFAFLFGFVPGIVLAICGYPYFVGVLTVFTVMVCVLIFFVMYCYQQKLAIPFQDSLFGFICFLLYFQVLQSAASIHGYLSYLLGHQQKWK